MEADLNARSDLFLMISPSELKQVKNCATSRDVWITLEGIYQRKGPTRKETLFKRLVLHNMREDDDVQNHLNKNFDTVDKLAEMGTEINADLLSTMLLYSLPSSSENFRVAIESWDSLPKPDDLKVKIIEEYEARKANYENSSQVIEGALLSK